MSGFQRGKSVTGYHAASFVTAFDTIGIPVFTTTWRFRPFPSMMPLEMIWTTKRKSRWENPI